MAVNAGNRRDGGRRPGWMLAGLLALVAAGGGGLRAQEPAAQPAKGLQGLGAESIVVSESAGPAGSALKAGTCVPSATVLCLGGGRFSVTVSWRQSGGTTGAGSVVAGSTTDSGLFWFFSATNYEMMIKVLNGCGVNSRYWIFFLATTNVGFTLTVTDTMTLQTKTYTNPPGTVSAVITDTNAFATCP